MPTHNGSRFCSDVRRVMEWLMDIVIGSACL
jgi:hypothetical protein